MYVNEVITVDKFLSICTSCEATSLWIIKNLKVMRRIQFLKWIDQVDTEFDINIDEFLIEVILYRRSHTFIIVKEYGKLYMVSAYLNLYTSRIEEIKDDIHTLLLKIYRIEYEDDVELHNELFKTEKVPCLSLDKKFSKIKMSLYKNGFLHPFLSEWDTLNLN